MICTSNLCFTNFSQFFRCFLLTSCYYSSFLFITIILILHTSILYLLLAVLIKLYSMVYFMIQYSCW